MVPPHAGRALGAVRHAALDDETPARSTSSSRPTVPRAGTPNSPRRAERTVIDGEPVLVITVSVWEALKQATGRAKDLEHLDAYYEARRDGSSPRSLARHSE